MTWPAERKLFRRNRRIEPHEVAMLIVIAVGTAILYFTGA